MKVETKLVNEILILP